MVIVLKLLGTWILKLCGLFQPKTDTVVQMNAPIIVVNICGGSGNNSVKIK